MAIAAVINLGIPCDDAFFSTLCAETLSPPPLYFEPTPNLSKTLKGLLMRLVVFENPIFQLKSLNITVSVCYMSGSKVNRKERSRPSLFNCVFCSTLLNISSCISEHLVPSCQCPVWGLKRAWEVWVDLHDHGNHNSPSHKSCSSTYTRKQTIGISTNFALTSLVVRGYPNHFDSGDRNLQLGGGK